MRIVKLTDEEKSHIEILYKSSTNSVVRQRCLSLLYSNEGRSMETVAGLVFVSRKTLERLFNAWEKAEDKYKTLSIAKGRGPKIKLESVKELLPELVQKHSRNLNPVLAELETKHNIKVCKLTLQNFLKGTGL